MPHRSPVIFWLMLAATLAVDAVAIYWINDRFGPTSAVVYYALAFAQLSLLSVWAILLSPSVRLRWIVPLGAGVIVALILVATQTPDPPQDAMLVVTVLMWGHVTVCACLLWLLKPTRLFARWNHPTTKPKWQFGTGHLLVLITLVAILSFMVKHADELFHERVIAVTLLVGNGLLLLAILVGRTTIAQRLMRLAASFGAALAIAAACRSMPLEGPYFSFYVFDLAQAAVIWSWAEILWPPHNYRDAGDEAPSMQEVSP